MRKTTFFKASPETLKAEGIMDLLRATWDSHPKDTANHTLKFALAWTFLRRTLKDLQDKARREEPSTELLQARLVQLKLEILVESDQFLQDEFQLVRVQIREAKLTKTNKIHNFSRVKWLGIVDDPRSSFLLF